MLQNNNRYKVLKIFLNSPTSEFGLREISREIKLALPSVKKYLLELEKCGLIRIADRKGSPVYIAERDSEKFKIYMRLSVQYELYESGTIDFIWKKLSPEAIVLYGAYAKGEATENSDIDLFVVGKKSEINLGEYEKILGKEIHLINDKLKNLPKELKNNLINGIIMKGYLKVLK